MKEKPKSALVLDGQEDETFAEYVLTDEAGVSSAEIGAAEMMRKLKALELSVAGDRLNSAEAALFEKQGSALAGYKDNYLRIEPFAAPNPTYQALSLNQMRTYASWRASAKQGVYREAPEAYVRLYVMEVMSLIGVADWDEAILELSWLLEQAPDELKKFIKESVKLLYIIGDFNSPFIEVLRDLEIAKSFPWLGLDNPLHGALLQAASRDPFDSEYVRANLDSFKEAFAEAIGMLEKLFNRYSLKVEDLLDRKSDRARWNPADAPIYRRVGDRSARISELESYKCKDGSWTKTKLEASEFEASAIGYIAHCVEVGVMKANGDRVKGMPSLSISMDWENVSSKRHAIGCALRDELFKPIIRAACAGSAMPEMKPLPSHLASAREVGVTLHVQSAPAKIFALQSLILKRLDGKPASSCNPGELPRVPIFHSLTNSQVRCYANWKAGYARGEKPALIESFVRLRAFELICEPSLDSLSQLSQLAELLKYTRDNGDGLYVTTQLARWVKDYYISRNCQVEFDIFINQSDLEWCFPSIAVSSSSLEDWHKIFGKLLNFKPKREEFAAECFNEAIREVETVFSARNMSFRQLFAEKQQNGTETRVLFREAVRPEPKPGLPKVSLGPLDTYARSGDSWTCQSESALCLQSLGILDYILQRVDGGAPSSGAFNSLIEAEALEILRSKAFDDAIDRAAARVLGSHEAPPAVLAEPEPEKFHTDYVFEEDEYPDDPLEKPFDSLWGYVDMPRPKIEAKPEAKKKAKAKKPVVTVDLAKLEEARREAAENTESLKISTEEEPMPAPEPVKKAAAAPETGWGGFSKGLSDGWASALEIMLSGGQKQKLVDAASKEGVMLEVMIESINALALECTGDVIIESEGNKVLVFDDYADDVKKALKARKK